MFQTFNVKELVEKQVVAFGNGSIVFTPKKWIGKTVLVVREEKPVDVAGTIMDALKPFLGSVQGVFLFGSFVRGEQHEGSDIDIVVIADKKLALGKKSNVQAVVLTRKSLEKALKDDANLFLHQALKEAKPVLNETLLQELRSLNIAPDVRPFFENTVGAFKKVNALLDLEQGKFLESKASMYSLILRLKTLFIIQCHVKKKAFSNKAFTAYLCSLGFSEHTVRGFLAVHKAERDDTQSKEKILLHDAKGLFATVKKECLKTEELVKQ